MEWVWAEGFVPSQENKFQKIITSRTV